MISPYLTFARGSEVSTDNPRLIQPPGLRYVRGFYYQSDKLIPTCPIPSYVEPTLPATPPCTIPRTYIDWVDIASYIVSLEADRLIYWCAPNTPGTWDLTKVVSSVTVKTGAGSATLLGSGAFKYGVGLGQIAVLFDAGPGIGMLASTGNWRVPFSYNQTMVDHTNLSYPVKFDGWAWYLGTDFKFYRTNGTSFQTMSEHLVANLTDGFDYTPSTFLKMGYNGTTGHMVVEDDATVQLWVSVENGGYSVKPASGSPYLETGVLDLVDADHACHVQYVRPKLWSAGATNSVQVAVKGIYDSNWTTGDSYTIPAGFSEPVLWVNKRAKEAQVRLTVTLGSGSPLTEIHGMSVAYEDGGIWLG